MDFFTRIMYVRGVYCPSNLEMVALIKNNLPEIYEQFKLVWAAYFTDLDAACLALDLGKYSYSQLPVRFPSDTDHLKTRSEWTSFLTYGHYSNCPCGCQLIDSHKRHRIAAKRLSDTFFKVRWNDICEMLSATGFTLYTWPCCSPLAFNSFVLGKEIGPKHQNFLNDIFNGAIAVGEGEAMSDEEVWRLAAMGSVSIYALPNGCLDCKKW